MNNKDENANQNIAEFTQKFEEVIVTLFEGHYYLGLGSFINSLYKSNFKGLIRVGYRGELPKWIDQLLKINNFYHINNFVYIEFLPLDVDMHFGYYKPIFLKDAINVYPFAKKFYYFDPDIVVNAPWSFFSNWLDCGIALCLDNCFYYLHHNHPWRTEWKNLVAVDEKFHNPVDYYVNSGFIGLNRMNVMILDRWITCTQRFKDVENGNLNTFIKDGYRAFKGDQELLNAVITTSLDLTFSIIGTEGMSFTQPGYLMTHAIHFVKPWKKNFLLELLKFGQKPDISEQNFFKYFSYPIQVFSSSELKLKKLNLKAASILGRVIG